MFKLVYWRHGSRKIKEFKTLEDAQDMSDLITDSGEGFVECILDQNDIMLNDEKDNVMGIVNESKVGQKYIFD